MCKKNVQTGWEVYTRGEKNNLCIPILSNDSGSILRISESILSLASNQMCDDTEFPVAQW